MIVSGSVSLQSNDSPTEFSDGSSKESNRFDSMPGMSPYISNVGGGVGFSAPGIPIEQGQLGVYDPEATRTQIAALEKVAMSQLMRSTGHKMGAQDPSNPAGTVSTTGVQKGRKKVIEFHLVAQTQVL